MKILYLETSSKNCSVAISDGTELLSLCEEVSENYKQSENLHQFVQWALEGADIELKDLDAVCLGKGPGSYTGLRIGASAAKGFCFSLDIPLIAVNSLDSMAFPFLNKGYDYIIPMIDARRQEVYAAVFDGCSGIKEVHTQSIVLDEISFSEYDSKKVLFVGDGAQKAADILKLSHSSFEPDVFPTAKIMLNEAVRKFEEGLFEDVAYFEPLYLKEFQGVKMADKNKKPEE